MPWPFKVLIGLAIAYVVLKVGFWMLRGLANPLPPPPPAGEMRRVSLRYRCDVCGIELKVTSAPDQDPPPPRHCTEEMELLAPIDD